MNAVFGIMSVGCILVTAGQGYIFQEKNIQ